MTGREKIDALEHKLERMAKQRFCEVCGEPLRAYTCQLAHRVAKSKMNVKKYGKEFIHSDTNTALVCGLKCNSSVLVRGTESIKQLIEKYEQEEKGK